MMMLHALLFRYSDIPLEEIQKICPACRGTCNCKVCLRGDNLIKVFQFWIKGPGIYFNSSLLEHKIYT